MEAVYLLEHVHIQEDGEEDVKAIGIYSTRALAEEAIERMKLQPGFCDAPEGFNIDSYKLNQDHWAEGYITVFD